MTKENSQLGLKYRSSNFSPNVTHFLDITYRINTSGMTFKQVQEITKAGICKMTVLQHKHRFTNTRRINSTALFSAATFT